MLQDLLHIILLFQRIHLLVIMMTTQMMLLHLIHQSYTTQREIRWLIQAAPIMVLFWITVQLLCHHTHPQLKHLLVLRRMWVGMMWWWASLTPEKEQALLVLVVIQNRVGRSMSSKLLHICMLCLPILKCLPWPVTFQERNLSISRAWHSVLRLVISFIFHWKIFLVTWGAFWWPTGSVHQTFCGK